MVVGCVCDVDIMNTCDHVYIIWYNNKVEGLMGCNEVSCLCCERKLDPLFAHKLYVCGETKLASSSSHLGTRYSCVALVLQDLLNPNFQLCFPYYHTKLLCAQDNYWELKASWQDSTLRHVAFRFTAVLI